MSDWHYASGNKATNWQNTKCFFHFRRELLNENLQIRQNDFFTSCTPIDVGKMGVQSIDDRIL